MSDDVGSVTTGSAVVENVRVAVGISLISHSVPEKPHEKPCTSGLESAILKHEGRLTSHTVDLSPFEVWQCQRCHHGLGHVRKYDVTVRISVILRTVPEKQCTSGWCPPF